MKKIAIVIFSVLFVVTVGAQDIQRTESLTTTEYENVLKSINQCWSLQSAKNWATGLSSTTAAVGLVVLIVFSAAANNDPLGGSSRLTTLAMIGAGAAFTGALSGSIMSFSVESPGSMVPLITDLGFGLRNTMNVQSFRNQCVEDGLNQDQCNKALDNLTAETRAGLVCDGIMEIFTR